MTTEPAQLSATCHAVLKREDCYAEPSTPNSYSVRDCDGVWLFSVTAGIDAQDLHMLFSYGSRMRSLGKEQGREAFKSYLRNAIGAAPLEPLS